MLVLSRKAGESVRIGHDIKLVVYQIRDGRKVRLAFEAPKHVEIHREEVYQKIHGTEADSDD